MTRRTSPAPAVPGPASRPCLFHAHLPLLRCYTAAQQTRLLEVQLLLQLLLLDLVVGFLLPSEIPLHSLPGCIDSEAKLPKRSAPLSGPVRATPCTHGCVCQRCTSDRAWLLTPESGLSVVLLSCQGSGSAICSPQAVPKSPRLQGLLTCTQGCVMLTRSGLGRSSRGELVTTLGLATSWSALSRSPRWEQRCPEHRSSFQGLRIVVFAMSVRMPFLAIPTIRAVSCKDRRQKVT